jgi:hypothetical protein
MFDRVRKLMQARKCQPPQQHPPKEDPEMPCPGCPEPSPEMRPPTSPA